MEGKVLKSGGKILHATTLNKNKILCKRIVIVNLNNKFSDISYNLSKEIYLLHTVSDFDFETHLTGPYLSKCTGEAVEQVFESLAAKGMGEILHVEHNCFFRVNEAKLTECFEDFGLTRHDVTVALQKPSKIPSKFDFLEGNYN